MHNVEHNGNMSYITEFKKGNTTAFSHFYNLYYPQLRYFAEQLIKDRAAAQDICTEIFIKLWQKRESFNAEENVRAFLYISTKHACFDFLKHARHKQAYQRKMAGATALEGEHALNQMIEAELYRQLYDAIAHLPSQCRRVFEMSYLEEMKNQEIADALSISINTVKTQKTRAIQLLRKKLNREDMVLWLLLCYYLINMCHNE